MPPNDVLQRTEQLIGMLRRLSQESGTSQQYLQTLEGVLSRLGNLRLGSLEQSVNLIAQFNRTLVLMGGNAEIITQIQSAFSDLARTMATVGTQSERMSFLGQAGAAQRTMNRTTTGFRATAEDLVTRRTAGTRLRVAREEAQRVGRELQESATTWQNNERYAQQLVASETRVLETLVAGQRRNDWTGAKGAGTRLGLGAFAFPTTVAGGPSVVRRREREEAGIVDVSTRGKPGTEEEIISEQSLRKIGLSQTAVQNLTKTLGEYGITAARIGPATTELSTGITTVAFTAQGAGGSMKTFTAHIDQVGNVLHDTQKRFRTFGSAVMRDVVEVLKWTIAIGAIYGPMRKMGEMLEQAKKIQLDLVDVQIALGSSTRDMQVVFEATSDIATQTSSSIEGVIEGYSLAVAAASSAGSEFQRMVTTNTLLKDSMILSKLANLDQKTSLDTLVGALSQLGMSLTQGTQLLDSWVAVAKRANVSINQLATSFTIVGTAAAEVGLDFNELNALIGTLAQATNLSADEVGNAIRGIIAAMQTDKAQAEFAKYGIATKNLSGDFRDFMDILREMKILQQGGILDEKAMSALTQAGGAGARRGAQLSALVENLSTAFELITVSQQANGEAAQAMQLEMKTLDAATTRLNNAFAMLAQTLGGEGGVLGFMTSTTNMITGLISAMRQLVSVMKGAAPVLATFALLQGVAGTATGARFMGAQIPGALASLFTPAKGTTAQAGRMYTSAGWAGVNQPFGMGKIGGFAPLTNALVTALQSTGWGASMGRTSTVGEFGGNIANFLKKPMFGTANLLSMLGPAVVMAGNLNRPKEEGVPRAVFGGLGALPGVLSGSPIWATIGSIIATGFYDEFLTFTDDIAASWSKWAAENKPEEPNAPTTKEDILAAMDKEVKGRLTLDEKWAINVQKWALNLGKMINPKQAGAYTNVGESEALLSLVLSGGKNIFGGVVLEPDTIAAAQKMYNEWINQQLQLGLIEGEDIPTTEIEAQVIGQIRGMASFAAESAAEMVQKALDDIAKGVPGAIQQYLDLQSIAESYASVSGNILVAQAAINATPGMVTPQMTPAEAVTYTSQLNPEELGIVSTLLTQINSAQNVYNKLVSEGKNVTEEDKKALDALASGIEIAKTQYISLIPTIQQAIAIREVEAKTLDIVEFPEGLTPEQRQEIITGAEELWREVFELSGIPENVINDFIQNQKQQIIGAGTEVFREFTNIPQRFISQQAEKMGYQAGGAKNINIQDLRGQMTQAQLPQLLARYNQVLNAMIQKFQYKPEVEPVGLIFKDGMDTVHVDLKILNMAMQDLIDETKKQGLQGIYNLPEGATFMIPVTAYEMSKQSLYEQAMGGGGGGGLPADIFSQYPTTSPAAEAITREQQRRLDMIERNTGEGAYKGITTASPLPVTITNFSQFLPLVGQKPTVPEALTFGEQLLQLFKDSFTRIYGENATMPDLSWLEKLGDLQLPDISKWFQNLNPFAIPTPQTNLQTEQPPVTTALNLAVDSNIQLIVDGRLLATIVKPFLYQDLIRYMTSAASTINRSVVG